MKRVLFDSSFLMAVVEHPTTWYEDMVELIGRFQPTLPECVGKELEKLASGQGRKARTARLALDLAAEFETTRCGAARVDDEIVSTALKEKAMVATVDAELKRTLRAVRVGTIILSNGRVALA
jgi:rRNA-processing protein FCF1